MVRINNRLIRRKLFLIVDTETFGTFTEPICYDIGFAVIDKTGKVYAKYSFVVQDTFLGMAEQAKTAYYADKFPQYHSDIREGKRKCVSFSLIRQVANGLLLKYKISNVVAHNANFDCTSLNYTARILGFPSFFIHHVEWWDTLQMVDDTICQQVGYKQFCLDNGYMTKHKNPRPQMKAEVIYRFITRNNDFVESHTGLEDVLIEKEIFASCFRCHKKMRHSFYVYR